jgi:hypothetical protein
VANWLKSNPNRTPLPATVSGPRPGDFPIGSLKSRAAARALLNRVQQSQWDFIDMESLDEFERVCSEHEDPEVSAYLARIARFIVKPRAAVFGFSLPTPEEIRHNRKIAKTIDEMTGGQNSHISLADSVEWNRLKALAEDVLSGKRAFTDSEIVAVRTTYCE